MLEKHPRHSKTDVQIWKVVQNGNRCPDRWLRPLGEQRRAKKVPEGNLDLSWCNPQELLAAGVGVVVKFLKIGNPMESRRSAGTWQCRRGARCPWVPEHNTEVGRVTEEANQVGGEMSRMVPE